MRKFRFFSKTRTNCLPASAGVYCFKKGASFLYIGKAVNIRERVKNHFQRPGFKDELFLARTDKIGCLETASEIEALLLEAQLIKKYRPKFNVVWKDDKNYFYVGITRERFPKVFITHQIQSQISSIRRAQDDAKLAEASNLKSQIGPFVDGKALKQTLRVLRRVFPYRTCRTLPKRPCLYKELGLCPAPCNIKYQIANIKSEFQISNIKNLMAVLRGEKTSVMKNLRKEMLELSGKQEFEKANEIKNQIIALENVLSHNRNETCKEFHSLQGLQKVLGLKNRIKRIEGYDVSNIQGKSATGSMVVFESGLVNKNEYRKFKIKTVDKSNDIAMIKEILARRMKHTEWPYPEVILIDGGIAQLNVGLNLKSPASNASRSDAGRQIANIKFIALAKRKNELYVEGQAKPVLLKNLPNNVANLILYIRDEAHRFAAKYHRKLRQKSLFI